MKTYSPIPLIRTALGVLSLAATVPAYGGGPLVVNGAGQPLVWQVATIPFNPDRGTLGALSNAEAIAHLDTAAAAWTAVPTSSVTIAAGSELPVDVTVGNYLPYLTNCGDGLSPIIFDTNGSITDDLLGVGANQHILGFAAPACGTYVPPVITEGYSVMNGRFLDGVDSPSNPELTAQEFDAVLTHELGHYIGLDHSQVNLVASFDGVPSNDTAIGTMFPILINPVEQGSLHLDDIAAVSSLYPEASFGTDFGTISGTILLGDGVTPVQGANVIARAVGDPLITAVAQVSGARYFPAAAGGPPDPALIGHYELPGLPPGSYTVEIESIYSGFVNGSSVGPFETPQPLPGSPEFWNGADEAGADPPDDPSVAEAVPVLAGSSVTDIDFVVNQGPVPPNDECVNAIEIDATPFSVELDVTGATRGAFDPLQCTSSQNYNSVWYRYTAPADGVVDVATAGSNYDTVVSQTVGACGAISEARCDNDSGPGVTSVLHVVVEAGVSYLFEVTCTQQGGGMLELSLDFTPAATCPAVARNDCRAPSTAGHSALRLQGGGDPAGYELQWKWSPGDTPVGELGIPGFNTGTSYALCIYDTGGLSMSARAPAGSLCSGGERICWRSTDTSVTYKDREMLPDGLGAVSLKSGLGGHARIKAKGAGGALDMPTLPLAFPLTVQLLNSDGHCWQSSFSIGDMQRNDTAGLKARGGS